MRFCHWGAIQLPTLFSLVLGEVACRFTESECSCQHSGRRWARAFRIYVWGDLGLSSFWNVFMCTCTHTGKLSDFFGVVDVWILLFIVYLSWLISLFVSFDGVVWMYCRLWETSSLTFLHSFINWILKGVGVDWKAVRLSSVFVCIFKHGLAHAWKTCGTFLRAI